MNNFQMVQQFQTAFGQPVADKPQVMDRGKKQTDKRAIELITERLEKASRHMKFTFSPNYGGRVMQRSSWILEELAEFVAATTLVDQVDALTDILYLVYGTAVEMGVDLDPCFEIVHACNMAKLGPDGKPIIDAQGKVRKPDGWEGPESILAAEIERQAND